MALVAALVVMLLLGGALALLAASLQLRMRIVRDETRAIRLTALSDAAVAATLAELAKLWSFPGLAERPYGGGTISSEVREIDFTRNEIVARAAYAGRVRRVRVVVTRTGVGLQASGWRRLPASATTAR
jgi:hypothetical protein